MTRKKAMSVERKSPIEINAREFKKLGYRAVERISRHLANIKRAKVTTAPSPRQVRRMLGSGGLPHKGTAPAKLLKETSDLILENSLFNGHPRFWGYISGAPAPIGILADFLASTVNPNVGAFILSPLAKIGRAHV